MTWIWFYHVLCWIYWPPSPLISIFSTSLINSYQNMPPKANPVNWQLNSPKVQSGRPHSIQEFFEAGCQLVGGKNTLRLSSYTNERFEGLLSPLRNSGSSLKRRTGGVEVRSSCNPKATPSKTRWTFIYRVIRVGGIGTMSLAETWLWPTTLNMLEPPRSNNTELK